MVDVLWYPNSETVSTSHYSGLYTTSIQSVTRRYRNPHEPSLVIGRDRYIPCIYPRRLSYKDIKRHGCFCTSDDESQSTLKRNGPLLFMSHRECERRISILPRILQSLYSVRVTATDRHQRSPQTLQCSMLFYRTASQIWRSCPFEATFSESWSKRMTWQAYAVRPPGEPNKALLMSFH